MTIRGRLDSATPEPQEGERTQTLASFGGAVVEHIVSPESTVPDRYVQDHDEWVMVVAGGAVVEIEGDRCRLGPGDWLLIPAGVVHTVVLTDAGTSWIAVHDRPDHPPTSADG